MQVSRRIVLPSIGSRPVPLGKESRQESCSAQQAQPSTGTLKQQPVWIGLYPSIHRNRIASDESTLFGTYARWAAVTS